MPKFNLELFKTLNPNFAFIHSKRKKLGMFILYQKHQFIYPYKINSSPIRQFPSFSTFGSCHVTIIKRHLKNYFRGKIHVVLGILARDIANQFYALNASLTTPWVFENFQCQKSVKRSFVTFFCLLVSSYPLSAISIFVNSRDLYNLKGLCHGSPVHFV